VWRKTTRKRGKGKREKDKGEDKGKTRGSIKKIRQLLGCLIEYGELFEL
jgi:hypothetical protein